MENISILDNLLVLLQGKLELIFSKFLVALFPLPLPFPFLLLLTSVCCGRKLVKLIIQRPRRCLNNLLFHVTSIFSRKLYQIFQVSVMNLI